jgi:hypothetical protein
MVVDLHRRDLLLPRLRPRIDDPIPQNDGFVWQVNVLTAPSLLSNRGLERPVGAGWVGRCFESSDQGMRRLEILWYART